MYGQNTVFAQNRYVDSLLDRIARYQVADPDPHYQQGMFPSQRIYLSRKRPVREDDNIFFTGLIVWTLKTIREGLSSENRQMVDVLCEKAQSNYFRYRNKDGGPTYNFWQTQPSRHFPNSTYFSSRKKYILPDDLDDTSIIYLSADFPDSLKAAVKKLMAENANGAKRTIRNTYKKYKKISAYSTWFGKNMPVDFDICVQANGLRFVLDNGFRLNRYDSATIRLINRMVVSGRYLKRTPYNAPHYQKASIILYHLVRLVAAHPQHAALYELKPVLLKDIRLQLQKVTNGMEKVLLHTSLLRLGEKDAERIAVCRQDMEAFYFFVANMTSVFPNPVKGLFAGSRRTNFFYHSQAYYLTLLLEHEMLRTANATVPKNDL
ncbi:hypothetical protein GCM10027516_31090 [Niabella aquatica]